MGMNIVILGGPGSGKKTQTGLLADNYSLTVLTAGELVKRALDEESELGSQLRQQQAGQQVADDIMLTLLQERLRQSDLGNGFILDGFPRNLLQALTLDELLGEIGLSLDFVLLFEIETDALMERLVGRRTCRSCKAVYNVYTQPTVVEDVCDLCGGRLHQRADDTEETVSSRLHVFDHLTAPLLSHYGKQGKVVRVDGEGEVDVVFARTRKAIERFLSEWAEAGVTEQQPAPDLAATVARDATPSPVAANEPAAKAVADDTAATGKKTMVKKKGAVGKGVKRSATSAQAGGKKSSRKPTSKRSAVKKKSVAKKTAAKSVASKQTVKRKSAVGKPTAKTVAKKRVVKKATKKQASKKRVASAKSKPLKKKATTKKATTKRATTKKLLPKKTAAAKPKSKKKPLAKSKAVKKRVKKQAAKKSAKRSSRKR